MSPGEPQAGTKGVQAAWLCAACMACAVGHRLQARVCLVKEWWREGDTLWRDQEFSDGMSGFVEERKAVELQCLGVGWFGVFL